MHKEGWIIEGGKIWSATLIGEYKWKSAIKLATGRGEFITTQDRFLEVKPETATEKRLKADREERANHRKHEVGCIKKKLSETPRTMRDLRSDVAYDYSPNQLHRRLHKWPELKDVVKTLGANRRWMYSLPKPPTSTCCSSPLTVVSGDEGTNHYQCTKCGKPADVKANEKVSYDHPEQPKP